MREFFKPWRRKIGVVTLVLASMLACLYELQLLCESDRAIAPGEDPIQSKAAWKSVMNTELAIVFALAMFSAFLLLSNPRPGKPPTQQST